MSTNSSIEWTDATWNPLRGCSVVSPGCHNCYAMKTAHRFSGAGGAYEGLTKQTKSGPQWTGTIRLAEDHLLDPLRWMKPHRVFVNSMSDLFHERVTDDAIDQFFAVMAMAHWHTFQVLTKRAERMRAYFADPNTRERINLEITMILEGYEPDANWPKSLQIDATARRTDDARATAPDVEDDACWPLLNVWLGVSVENQHFADERIPLLLQTPAAVRFISAEPLLGPVDLVDQGQGTSWLTCHQKCSRESESTCMTHEGTNGRECFRGLDWVIVGGESGPGARPFDTSFARSIVKQCALAGVACFVKQLGAKPEQPTPGAWNTAHRERMARRDRKGGDMSEWPADLRVREFPNAAAQGRTATLQTPTQP